MANPLAERKCKACEEGNIEPLDKNTVFDYLQDVPAWQATDDYKEIYQVFVTKNFTAAVDFINKIKDVAEDENHHPDIHLTNYRDVRIELTTHAIGGLSENDFIMAAKIDTLPVELKK